MCRRTNSVQWSWQTDRLVVGISLDLSRFPDTEKLVSSSWIEPGSTEQIPHWSWQGLLQPSLEGVDSPLVQCHGFETNPVNVKPYLKETDDRFWRCRPHFCRHMALTVSQEFANLPSHSQSHIKLSWITLLRKNMISVKSPTMGINGEWIR